MKKSFYVVNFITFIRVVGALFLIPIYLRYGFVGLSIAAFVFLSTDSIDGFLARTLKVSTFFGAAFDALSDKLFNIVILSIIVFNLPIMLVALLLEIGILTIGFHSAFKGNKSKTSILGKVKMVIMSLGIFILLVMLGYNDYMSIFNLQSINTNQIIDIVCAIILLFETITFLDYLRLDIKYTKSNTLVNETVFKKDLKDKKEIKRMLFSHEFYEENKNVALEHLVLKK